MVKIVYAGLLGVAQDMKSLIQNINFRELGAELHIFGGGNQKEDIKKYIAEHPDCEIFFHGYIEPSQLKAELQKYDVALIPLTTNIKGAVPSKIFDMLPLGLPILFGGSGEGATIVERYQLGFVSNPDDMNGLKDNIKRFSKLSLQERQLMGEREKKVAYEYFNFEKQMEKFHQFINKQAKYR